MAKILVVDDEADMIWALTNVLLSENHSVISVSSGEDALVKVREVPVDLVLLDFRLPGMDGVQILEKIKEIKPDLPVIMVTGYGGIEEAVQSIKLGADHYIAKPFENEHLIETVNKSLKLDSLKKGGVFSKRIVDKIEPRSAQHEKTASQARGETSVPGKSRWKTGWAVLATVVLAFAFGALANIYSGRDRVYSIPTSKISGLSWGGGSLWVSDWFTQTVQRYALKGDSLELQQSALLPGYHITGIAWADGGLYTCDSWKRMIFRHQTDEKLAVLSGTPSPGPNPSGLFYDGKYLWSCDGNTRKIYQHTLDDKLTVVAAYDSPGVFPVGLYHDKKNFWSASAVGLKIYRQAMSERFRLDKVYAFPEKDQTGQQISAFTLNGTRVWIAYEGLNRIFDKSLKSLKEVPS